MRWGARTRDWVKGWPRRPDLSAAALLPPAGEGGAERRMRCERRECFKEVGTQDQRRASLRSRSPIRPSGTFSRKREKGCFPIRALGAQARRVSRCARPRPCTEIGRASGRENACTYVEISVGAGSFKQKKQHNTATTQH